MAKAETKCGHKHNLLKINNACNTKTVRFQTELHYPVFNIMFKPLHVQIRIE